MIRIITIIACLLLSIMINAQVNLVPNGSFEQYDTCPSTAGQIYKAVGWSNYIYDAEYFNSCANISQPLFGVPNNCYGSQIAQDGIAYSLLEVFAYGYFPNGGEIIGRQLSQPLDTSKTYYCSFYIVGVKIGNPLVYVDKIGMNFSTVPHGCAWCQVAPTNPSLITNSAAIYSNNIINDSINWTQISGWYKPDSAYNYIMLGNFFDTTHLNYYPSNLGSAVYYLDNVYVGLDSVESVSNIKSIIKDLIIYPNPIHSTLNIRESIGTNHTSIVITDLLGKEVYRKSLENISNQILDLSDLPGGVYCALFYAYDQLVCIKKIVKI